MAGDAPAVNSVLYDFRNVPCHVKAKVLSTYCLDLCGSQLWNFSSIHLAKRMAGDAPAVNSVLYDFRNVPCHVKAKLLSTYCLDLWIAIMEL